LLLCGDTVVSANICLPVWWPSNYVMCHQQRWLWWKSDYHTYGSLQYTSTWHGALHARCVVVETIATMRVQNFAGSRIKNASYWVCYLFSYNI